MNVLDHEIEAVVELALEDTELIIDWAITQKDLSIWYWLNSSRSLRKAFAEFIVTSDKFCPMYEQYIREKTTETYTNQEREHDEI